MNPLKIGTKSHPTGQQLNVSLAFKLNKSNWQRAAKKINDVIKRLPFDKKEVDKDNAPTVSKSQKRTAMLTNFLDNAQYITNSHALGVKEEEIHNELSFMANAVRYDYAVDAQLMSQTMTAIDMILIQDILGGSDFWTVRFFLNSFIESASNDGVVSSLESAKRITSGTSAEAVTATITAQSQLQAPQYLKRIELVNGRVFENMNGLTSEIKAQLRQTLTEGMARGLGTRDLTGMINRRLSVGMVRAERIARTEINRAYTTAYMDEATELNETALQDSEWLIKQAQRSALSSTTRASHADRHGGIFTAEEMANWWATDGNGINCLCSVMDVLVNKVTGEVLQSNMITSMKEQRIEFKKVGVK